MAYLAPTSDFVTSTLNGAIVAGATSATIGTGLDLPATNGILQIDYDSTTAVGADNGPETIAYATYTSGTGALTGLTRGLNGTTGVAHANGAKVQCGPSASYWGTGSILAADLADGIISNAKLNTTAGEPGGEWKSWTPNLINLSGGTINYAKYTQIGKTIKFKFQYTLAGAGVGGDVQFTLPVTAVSGQNTASPIGMASLVDTGTGAYSGIVTIEDTTHGKIRAQKADGTYTLYAVLSSTIPHTWANTDVISIIGTYEAA